MNTKDKTRQKLVGSMRKTKAAAGIGDDQSEEKTAPVQAAPERPRSAAQSKTPSAPTVTATGPDPYQCGRRVWPD